MAKGVQLTSGETKKKLNLLKKSTNTCQIAKLLKRDHRTIKKFIMDGGVYRKTASKFKLQALSAKDLRKLKHSLIKTPHATSKAIIDNAGITDVPKKLETFIWRNLVPSRRWIVHLLSQNHTVKDDWNGPKGIWNKTLVMYFGQTYVG